MGDDDLPAVVVVLDVGGEVDNVETMTPAVTRTTEIIWTGEYLA